MFLHIEETSTMTLVLLMLTAAEQTTAAGLLTAESRQQLYIRTINYNNPQNNLFAQTNKTFIRWHIPEQNCL